MTSLRSLGRLSVDLGVTVAFHDVDVLAVVWHGHYFKYLENARWLLMDRIGYGYQAMVNSGYGWPIIEIGARYVRAARFGDRLNVRASLVEWETRLAVNYLVTDSDTGERVLRGRSVQAAVALESGLLQFVLPGELRTRVARALSEVT
jgi:acyl-CoA thioester hydrolase